MLHPITFSISEEKIIKYVPEKKKMLSTLIPGVLETYIYNNEQDYYNQYKESYFAVTTKKAGWDCMRHYEILANGCMPYFIDIENCPPNTLALLPKELLLQANQMYKNIGTKNIDELVQDEKDEYNILMTKLLEYTRTHLSSRSIAKYILEKTSHQNVKKILYLSGNTFPDYLRCLTLHGFKQLLGSNCHDYPKISHIYKNENSSEYIGLYGKGISYTNVTDTDLYNVDLDKTIETDIKNKYYDIVIYGSYHRGLPYYDLVNTIYKPNEIILMCGEDSHNCPCDYWLSKGHYLFVREL